MIKLKNYICSLSFNFNHVQKFIFYNYHPVFI